MESEYEKHFIESLIWSAVSELERNSDRKINVITKIFDLFISEKYNIADKVCDATEEPFNALYEKYKLCYLNCLRPGYYLQNGRYNKEFIEKSKLGDGNFGEVYEVCSKSDHRDYALKKVRILENFDRDMNKTLNEIKIWKSLKSEFIVQYECAWIEEIEYKYDHHYSEDDSIAKPEHSKWFRLTKNNTLFIQMELCETTLEKLTEELNIELNQTEETGLNPIGFHIVFKKLLEIAAGAHYLHTQNPPLIHRDIKPSNILIKQHSNSSKFIKIGDFGLMTPQNRDTMTHTGYVGTPEYIAPEVMNGKYNEMSDIYSIGIVMSKMLLLRQEDIVNRNIPPKYYSTDHYKDHAIFETSIYYAFKQTMKLCEDSAAMRPTATDILSHTHLYSIPIEDVKQSSSITDLYYKMLKNDLTIGSGLLTQILLKYLRINESAIIWSNVANDNIIPFESIIQKTSEKMIEDFDNFYERELYFKKKGLKFIVLQMEDKYVNQLIELFTKHNIKYKLLYRNNCNVYALLLGNANYRVIQNICKIGEKIFQLKNNDDINFLISRLHETDKLENLI